METEISTEPNKNNEDAELEIISENVSEVVEDILDDEGSGLMLEDIDISDISDEDISENEPESNNSADITAEDTADTAAEVQAVDVESKVIGDRLPAGEEDSEDDGRTSSFIKMSRIFKDSVEEICNGTLKGKLVLSDLIRYCRRNASALSIYDYLEGDYFGAGVFEAGIRAGLIAAFFCKRFEYSQDATQQAIIAALLHDVGEAYDELAGRDKVEHIPLIFKKLLSTRDDRINYEVRDAIYQHHESCDGSGYPIGAIGDKVSVISSLLHIIDDYLLICVTSINPETISDKLRKNRDRYVPGIYDSFIKLVI